jgi:hypothetical protein
MEPKKIRHLIYFITLFIMLLDPGAETRNPGWKKNPDYGSGINIPDLHHCGIKRYGICSTGIENLSLRTEIGEHVYTIYR